MGRIGRETTKQRKMIRGSNELVEESEENAAVKEDVDAEIE